MSTRLPRLAFYHRQRATAYDCICFERLVRHALPRCVALAPFFPAEIEISILSRRAIATIHRDFLQIPGATDVITFPYGEIFLCAPIAADRAAEFGHTATDELALYAIHGLLHLAGLDDLTPADARVMARTQNRLLTAAQKSSP